MAPTGTPASWRYVGTLGICKEVGESAASKNTDATNYRFSPTVFRIRDILVQIRVTDMDPDPAPDPDLFVSDAKTPTKQYFFAYCFLRYIYLIL